MDQDAPEYSVFLLELQHAVDLVTEGGVVAERMALTITDSLAERLSISALSAASLPPTPKSGF